MKTRPKHLDLVQLCNNPSFQHFGYVVNVVGRPLDVNNAQIGADNA